MSRGADDDGNGSRTRRRCRRSVAETNHRRRPDHSLKVGRHLFTGDTLFPGGPGLTGWPLSDFPTIIDSIRQKRRHGVSDDDMLHAVRHHWRARLSLTRSKGTHIVLHRTGAGRSQRHGWRSVLFVRTPDIGGPIPVVSSASIGIRSNGASVGSVLNAQAVTEAVASNSEGPRNQAARIGFARPEVAMRIFISYRRDDTAGRAGRLFDQLVARFGSRSVFQDVAAMTPGADFTQQVR